MTKETMIALVAATGGVLAIGGGVMFWSADKPTPEPVRPPAVVEQITAPSDNHEEVDYEGMPEEDITRIIIDNGDQNGGEIQSILSEKVIINDEVKDIKDVDPAGSTRSL